MPIDTDSTDWKSGDAETSTRTDILEFLESNPNHAYSLEDIAEEALNTDLDIDIPEGTDSLGEMLGVSFVSLRNKTSLRAILRTHLSSLVYEGKAEVRSISNEDLDNDMNEGEMAFYTAAN